MPDKDRRTIARKLACTALGSAAVVVANSGVALAAYGPPTLPTTPVQGGYYCIVTSQTVSRDGRVIGPIDLGGLTATLRIRRDTFSGPVQVTITEPYGLRGACQGGAGVGDGGFRGRRALGGVGILVQRDGSAYRQGLRRPFTFRLSAPAIAASSIVVKWNGRRFVAARHAVTGRRLASVSGNASTDYAILVPTARRRAASVTTALRAPAGDFLAAALPARTGAPQPGLGVLAN
jgi:hypothetical protein